MSIITIEAFFDTTKEKVWEAITQPEIMKIWYFDIANFNLNIGNKFSFYEGKKKEYLHAGEVLEVEENKLFQHSWLYPEQSKGISVVKWQIEEIDSEKVKVTVSHQGVDSFVDGGDKFALGNYQKGWNTLVKNNLKNYLYGIKKLVFTQEIKASAETVWNKMWDKKSYTEWTTPFCAGSYFVGEMELGSRIHFLAPSFEGMYSDVFYLIPNKWIVFKHIGMLKDSKEQSIDAESEKWTGSFETYKLNESDGITTVTVEVDCIPEYINHMNEKFPLALEELKKISE